MPQVLPRIGEDALDPVARRVDVEQGRVLGLAPGSAALPAEASCHGMGHLPAVVALSALIARGLRPLRLIACASPTYLAHHSQPKRPDDLARHICLGFAGSALEERWTFSGDGGETVVPIVSRFSTNSGEALRQAALAGLGIVLHVEELLADDVATGRLVHILPEWRSERPLHILYAPDRRITPKLRSFLDFAAARFGPA